MKIDLSGKVGMVTGAGAGIGRHLALTFAREGVRPVAIDRSDEALDSLKGEFDRLGLEGLFLSADVTDVAAVRKVVETVVQEHHRIDILVNNAGVAVGGPVETLPEDRWDLNFDVNTKGTFLMSQAVIPQMKKQRSGRIINASSFAAIVPSTGGSAYAASKAAVVSFTSVLAGELGPWDITVNCYAPGMVPTGMNNFAKLPPETAKLLLDTLTLRRWETPEDVGNLVCFLASDLASYITGSLIDVSGGKLATQRPYAAYDQA
ncbi:MAG: SDR family oxidoreductase [Spirochaetales bacterium]|nr:MAG: SDR family oxidoreductase [Spirochaetales bacterium]